MAEIKREDLKQLDRCFVNLEKYHQEHGNLFISNNDKRWRGAKLSQHLAIEVYNKYQGDLPKEILEKYETIGMLWDKEAIKQGRKEYIQQEHIAFLEKYNAEHGSVFAKASTDAETNITLQKIDYLKVAHQNGELPEDIKQRCENLGIAMVATWEEYYDMASQYVQIFGSPIIPKEFVLQGVELGRWVEEQRKEYTQGTLSIDRACKLGDIGISWSRETDHISYDESTIAYYVSKCYPDTISSFRPPELKGKELDIYIPSLKTGIEFDGKYHRTKLDKDLEKNQLCKEGGYKLIRVRVRSLPAMESDDNCTVVKTVGTQNMSASKRQDKTVKKVLEALGIPEEKMPSIDVRRDKHEIAGILVEDKTFFNQYLIAAKNFVRNRGHLLVPVGYEDPTGLKLGKWINTTIRNSRQYLTERQINALDDLGMVWRDVEKEKWLTNLAMVQSYKGDIPDYAITTDEKSLKDWYNQQREDFTKGHMTEDYKIDAMKSIENTNEKAIRPIHKNRGDDER